ncbi:MAG: DMT family transporter [Betaproteobacteria bacterium]|jgi:drug/metabolite transporter (DMT)-like permease
MIRAQLATGTLFALLAGLMWGLVFVAPLLLPEYPAVLQSFARYLAFGLIALPLAWWDRAQLARLSRADWVEALKLSLVGNLLYYLFLAAAIQRAGGPLPTMIIGTLPVVIAVVSNLRGSPDVRLRDGRLPWRQLAPSLLLIAAGIACVNHVEWVQLQSAALTNTPQSAPAAGADGSLAGTGPVLGSSLNRYALGALLAVGAVICWTWYPIRNADWLRAHADRSPRAWATAQGLVTLPLAAGGFALFWAWNDATGQALEMPFGPTPELFLGLMFAIGLFASWLGTLCWNEASQRLPPLLVGQLIVFETLAALSYAWVLRGRWPDAFTLAGATLLVGGVVWAVRAAAQRPPTPGRLNLSPGTPPP